MCINNIENIQVDIEWRLTMMKLTVINLMVKKLMMIRLTGVSLTAIMGNIMYNVWNHCLYIT